MKNDFRALGMKILSNGKIEGHEVEMLRTLISADGTVDRQEAEFLLDIFKRLTQLTPAFEKFFYKVIKQHVLEEDIITTEQARWLCKVILADGKINEREKKLLREIQGEAQEISPEGQALIEDCLAATRD
jgi:uncharacterized tellurite resistance protein B-like protein